MTTTLSDSIIRESFYDGRCPLLATSLSGSWVLGTKISNSSPASPESPSSPASKTIKSKWPKSTTCVCIKDIEKKISLPSSSLKSLAESTLKINGKLFILLVETYPLLSAELLTTTGPLTPKNSSKSSSQVSALTKPSLWSKNSTAYHKSPHSTSDL